MKSMSPQGTFGAFAASEQSHWGSELHGRYISVQEHKSRRLRLSRWFIPPPQSPAEESCQFLWHHFRVTSVHSVGKKEKKKCRDSCLHIQLSVLLCWEWGSKLGLLPRCSIGREDGVDMKSFSRRDALGDKRLWGTLASNQGCRWEVGAKRFHEQKQHFVLCLKDTIYPPCCCGWMEERQHSGEKLCAVSGNFQFLEEKKRLLMWQSVKHILTSSHGSLLVQL